MTITLLQGDARAVLPTLPSASVQCVVTSPPYYGLRSYLPTDHPDKAAEIGSERTPAEYIAALVEVFREVRRVLRRDGTLWLNLGDSYVSNGRYDAAYESKKNRGGMHAHDAEKLAAVDLRPAARAMGIKSKDLLMMPARVALALQADGWWLRSDIIWAKPNPMPESVTDRPTSAHEHVFLLAKSATYFYDADAVRETGTIPAGTLGAKGSVERFETAGVNSRPPEYKVYSGTRNLRNVWTIATAPFSEAHFATFPPTLVERCVKAGTSERGCCAACGAPWGRISEARPDTRTPYATIGTGAKAAISRNDGNGFNKVLREDGTGGDLATIQRTTTGWSPSCSCPASEPVPCTVLDPFSGAGTTAMVADRLGRHAIGIDLSPTYGAMSRERIVTDAGLFADFAPAAEAAE